MAGKMCTGEQSGNSYQPRLTKSYAEGRIGAIAGYPGAVANPFPAGTPENLAWKRGFDSYNGPAGNLFPRDCVAERGTF